MMRELQNIRFKYNLERNGTSITAGAPDSPSFCFEHISSKLTLKPIWCFSCAQIFMIGVQTLMQSAGDVSEPAHVLPHLFKYQMHNGTT